jgi:hypothetical protein
LVLDTDFLSHRAFDGESALLDKDELFTLKDKKKETTTRIVTRPKYPNLGPPPVKMSQIEYFKKLYNPTMPNFGQIPDLEDALLSCIESAVENLLLGAAITIATGGLGSRLIASLLFDLITDCVGGVIVEGGLEDFIIGIAVSMYDFWSDGMYESYERNFEQIERNYNQKKSEVIVEQVQVENESEEIIEKYAFTSRRNYNVENLGENYSVNPVEYVDQILPFDIVIIGVNEYGQSAQMRIYGVEALGESKSMSINDISVEYEIPFVARAILPWRSFELKTK